ncbi:Uncharacterised protein [Salmonella enterica subsp. enterica serovar Bovismorbificans]|uniref:Uncharacterized protein n=1 Tax=Salmonella enterica subsp. enterica serovar Bovismorbificans TaxID=58097 RepID=A0A655EL93_SALET|nr:Uncharacterised protein [Salmonella enterica subsp. enterica serovar Bovismorbificans]
MEATINGNFDRTLKVELLIRSCMVKLYAQIATTTVENVFHLGKMKMERRLLLYVDE